MGADDGQPTARARIQPYRLRRTRDYGQNLPRSWGGQYRTRQGTKVNYHEQIADEVARKDVPKIINDIRRRRR